MDDVDLTVGGALETHVPGTLSGPTFLCIMLKQFQLTRIGDRYWFETGDPSIAFTIGMLISANKNIIYPVKKMLSILKDVASNFPT